MNFPGYINLFGDSLSQSQKIYSLNEFVKEVVNDEIETCRLTKSKTLLLQIKDPLIKYLTTEYYKVPNGKFVDYVCELVNLDQIFVPTFTKAFFALESIATKMEECRNVIRSQKDQDQLDKNYEEYLKRRLQKEPTKEKSPEPQPRTKTNNVCHDPRPNPYKYSPPKSIFDPKEPAVFKNSNGSTSNVHNLGASNGIPQKDITMSNVADEQPPPVTDLFLPRISSELHSTQPSSMVSPPRLPFQPRQNGPRARSLSYYRDKFTSNNTSFNSTATATYSNTKSAKPADLSSSSRSYVSPTPYEKRTSSLLDAESEEEEEEQRQPVNKRKRVGFHDSTRDNEGAARGKYLDNATVTLATPLSEHIAVDHKLSLEINSSSKTMAAFPNQPLPITIPSRIVYENWQRNVTNKNMDAEFEEDIIEALQQFRYNNRNKSQKPKLHLVIKDSLLFLTNFRKKYKQCLEIDAKYPQKM
uniref:Uncharacterized protein n=1 Tax=Panagrolaimus sp. PS1159 TaxID=55785 RepID=A0AC35F5S9_9BILA